MRPDYCIVLLFARFLFASTVIINNNSTSWDNWSSCSHSCNSGVMSRDCLSGNCSQSDLQYCSCNNQVCPVYMINTRDQQCIKDVQEYLPQHSQLTWKAIKDGRVGELCELFCIAESHSIQITPPINDGTPCVVEDGTNGRCIGKLCAPVGCDGILGSDKHYDSCHRCSKDDKENEDCKKFKNTLAITNNKQTLTSFIPIHSMTVIIKYNHQIDLLSLSDSQHFPVNFTECSLDGNAFKVEKDGTITARGPLTQALTIILKPTDSTVIKPTVTFEYHLLVQASHEETATSLSNNTTYQWTQGEFSTCSVICGGGIEIAHAFCQDSAFPDKIMPDKFCQNTKKPFPLVRKCSRGDCPARWVSGEWGVCSTRCSNGTKYRNVKCWKKKKDGSDFFVSDSECNNLAKPDTAIGCNVRPCGTHWKSSDWSICSRRCGLGIQNRSIVCVDTYSLIVNELYCIEDADKPPSIRPCDEGPCYYSWYTSEWSKCSQSCGEGVKTRTVYCSDQNAIPVKDINCANLSKPTSQQSCHQLTGCFAAWITSQWSPCQGPCGSAHQTRVIDCYVFVGNEAESIPNMCDNTTKPNTTRICPIDQCAQWVTGEWQQCSAECGPGVAKRTVSCVKGDVTSNECDIKKKPPDSAPCEIKPCTDCSDNAKMDCVKMMNQYGCGIGFIKQVCCKTCSI